MVLAFLLVPPIGMAIGVGALRRFDENHPSTLISVLWMLCRGEHPCLRRNRLSNSLLVISERWVLAINLSKCRLRTQVQR